MSFVQIAVARPVRGLFTYAVPDDMALEMGHAVQVPFGRQQVTGYVIETTDSTELKRTRPVSRLLDPAPVFDSGQLSFFQWIASYYLASLGEVIAGLEPEGSVRIIEMPS